MTQKPRHLVVGLGEIGTALVDILSLQYEVDGHDIDKSTAKGLYETLHIAFPCVAGEDGQKAFIAQCVEYKNTYLEKGGYMIIHSTVPLGTTRKIGSDVLHSPVRGVHPHLKQGLMTFVKFVGGGRAEKVSEIFAKVGIRCQPTQKPENTEAMKLWDTTQYGMMIVLEKAIHAYCAANKVDFGLVYKLANETYNEGYERLGRKEVRRPVLKHAPGKIGGHCVVQNASLLNDDIGDIIIAKNKTY